MTTNFSGSPSASGSAKIYTFPARGRFAVSNQREGFDSAAKAQLPAGVKIVSGSGWYHDEAIQAEPRRKN
jgi:hypothetical protein